MGTGGSLFCVARLGANALLGINESINFSNVKSFFNIGWCGCFVSCMGENHETFVIDDGEIRAAVVK
jgi:hypothetical protein